MGERRPVVFSGIQPSGELTIANYIGAIKNWVALQDTHDCYFVLVDLHAITVRQDPTKFRQRCLDFLALYLACGIDPEKSTVFVQSHVSTHAELAWMLNCYTYMGELGRMTQFKDKSKKHEENINAGLFTYPVLMAADILLYQTDQVPVGEDQRQHLELARDVAIRFNGIYGDVFRVPEAIVPKVGARIMSLGDPLAKMSKSDPNPRNYIALLDSPEIIRSKIKKAVTDSGESITFSQDRPALYNLISIYSTLSGKSPQEIVDQYQGKGYAEFKSDLAELVVEFLQPVQERYTQIRQNREELDRILATGAQKAWREGMRTLRKVYKKVGFIPPVRE